MMIIGLKERDAKDRLKFRKGILKKSFNQCGEHGNCDRTKPLITIISLTTLKYSIKIIKYFLF